MNSIAIIGANYGDEGKGLLVDYFSSLQRSSGSTPIVTRFNGGAQHGRTVVHNSLRHIFRHLSAGSFHGAISYLSSQMVLNPLSLMDEFQENAFSDIIIFAHPHCQITTVFDIIINNVSELIRGDQRHGSTGIGFNETIVRSLSPFSLKLYQLKSFSVNQLEEFLKNIFHHWFFKRFSDLGISEIPKEYHSIVYNHNFHKIAEDLKFFSTRITSINLEEMKQYLHHSQSTHILEGSGGLGIDQELGDFPFVTRSITGLPSAIAVASYELESKEITPYYVTRPYLTRHGPGNLPNEGVEITSRELMDLSNVDTSTQGPLRYAPLHLGHLRERIVKDIERSQNSTAVKNNRIEIHKPKLVITCLDHLGEFVKYFDLDGKLCSSPSVNFPQIVVNSLSKEIELTYLGYGSSFSTIRLWN